MPEKPIDTKQNVINKSLQLFSKKGYYSTTISDILRATKLSKGGLYCHFSSKKDIWYATYAHAVVIWKDIVFKEIKSIEDPLERIEKVLETNLQNYLGKDVRQGGCFFLTMLVDLSGDSNKMLYRVLDGIMGFSNMLNRWLLEAEEKKMLKAELELTEIAEFITVSINGCTAIYASSRDPGIWKHTMSQLTYYIDSLKK